MAHKYLHTTVEPTFAQKVSNQIRYFTAHNHYFRQSTSNYQSVTEDLTLGYPRPNQVFHHVKGSDGADVFTYVGGQNDIQSSWAYKLLLRGKYQECPLNTGTQYIALAEDDKDANICTKLTARYREQMAMRDKLL